MSSEEVAVCALRYITQEENIDVVNVLLQSETKKTDNLRRSKPKSYNVKRQASIKRIFDKQKKNEHGASVESMKKQLTALKVRETELKAPPPPPPPPPPPQNKLFIHQRSPTLTKRPMASSVFISADKLEEIRRSLRKVKCETHAISTDPYTDYTSMLKERLSKMRVVLEAQSSDSSESEASDSEDF